MTIEADRAVEYLEAVSSEAKKGKEFLLAYWDAGAVFRKYNDNAVDIAEAIGRKPAYVYDRIKIAGRYTRAQLIKVLDKKDISTIAELLAFAFGRQGPAERTRRSFHVPLTLMQEAEGTGHDAVAEIRDFLSEVRWSELQAIMATFHATRQANASKSASAARSSGVPVATFAS